MTRETPSNYFMHTRVKGTIRLNHMKNRISEVTVELFDRLPEDDDSAGGALPVCICSITYNYDTATYVTRAGLSLSDEQLRMMTTAYSPAKIQSEGIDMAAEYPTEYAPFSPVDVTEHGLLVYAGDIDLLNLI